MASRTQKGIKNSKVAMLYYITSVPFSQDDYNISY